MSSTSVNGASHFVDSNILVYAHDLDAGDRRDQARSLVRDLWATGRGVISIQVLQEFFVTVTRKPPSPLSIDDAAEVVDDYAKWAVHSPTPDDIQNAIAIQRRYDISFWDAMVINSAAKMGCSVLFSEDLNHGQSYGGVQVVNPFTASS